MLKIQSCVFAIVLLIAAIGLADEISKPQAEQQAQKSSQQSVEETNQLRLIAAELEFDARLAEYLRGQSPANIVIRANQTLLRASLDCDLADALVTYDERAMKIAQFAKVSLQNGTGTQQELKQAEQAILKAMLKRYLDTQ